MSEFPVELTEQQMMEFQEECRRENRLFTAFVLAFCVLVVCGISCIFAGVGHLGILSWLAAVMALVGGVLMRGISLRCPGCGSIFTDKGHSYMVVFCPDCGVRLRPDLLMGSDQ